MEWSKKGNMKPTINELSPNNYKVHLELDPMESSLFQGFTEVEFNTNKLIKQISLNIENIAIWDCKINHKDKILDCSFEVKHKEQELLIDFPEKMEGNFKIIINYMGKFSNDLLGLYRSKYVHDGKDKFVISTQFEEHYARRAFPCMDHPSKKSTFNIEYVIDKELVAISNTAIKEEKELENDKKLVIFKQTPKMCTYLLYFGVSHFEFIEDSTSEHLVRVAATPGKAKYGEFALGIAKKSIKFCEEYTGLKYPISKCDLIGVPDFAFGAMENYGAITFRETLLFLYPKITSSMLKLSIAAVTAHEVSHFWFGDLVSPTDWKYIWLNESFASYFTFAIPDNIFPEWNVWEHFITQYYTSALERDGLIETLAVELPGEVKGFSSPAKSDIVYNKGASVLRMLQGYLGEHAFKKAINHFLKKYEFSSANTTQYWEAFEVATEQPIKEFAENWIKQPGYPIINVVKKNNELTLSQERFTYLANNSTTTWLIPIELLFFLDTGEMKPLTTTMQGSNKTLEIPDNTVACKLNHQHKGFYRVKYDNDTLMNLGKLIKNKKLTPIDRYGIENDIYSLLKRGDYSLSEYLEFISINFSQERDYLPLITLISHLMELNTIVDSKRKMIQNTACKIFKSWFDKNGYKPIEGEEISIAILRDPMLWSAYVLGDEEAAIKGENLFKDVLEGKEVHQDILSSVYKIGAASNEEATNFFLAKVMSPETPEAEKLYILQALGCFKTEKKIREAFKLTLKQVPVSSRQYVFGTMRNNSNAIGLIWAWFLKNQEKMEKENPMAYMRALATLIPKGGLDHENEVKEFFEKHKSENEDIQDTVRMALEMLEIYSKIRDSN